MFSVLRAPQLLSRAVTTSANALATRRRDLYFVVRLLGGDDEHWAVRVADRALGNRPEQHAFDTATVVSTNDDDVCRHVGGELGNCVRRIADVHVRHDPWREGSLEVLDAKLLEVDLQMRAQTLDGLGKRLRLVQESVSRDRIASIQGRHWKDRQHVNLGVCLLGGEQQGLLKRAIRQLGKIDPNEYDVWLGVHAVHRSTPIASTMPIEARRWNSVFVAARAATASGRRCCARLCQSQPRVQVDRSSGTTDCQPKVSRS